MQSLNMIKIFGKDYITVAERLKMAQKEIVSINTEVLYQEPVVIKATVITKAGTFTGISAANPMKTIEKSSPYEVAETSAVGRALGFAGYGIVDSIATAEEMVKIAPQLPTQPVNTIKCTCNAPQGKPHGTQCPKNRQSEERR